MSIDAVVKEVVRHQDGSGKLVLADRTARPGGVPGIAGQKNLYFDRSPDGVVGLQGREIWGGADSIMLGETMIARRVGYTKIIFLDGVLV